MTLRSNNLTTRCAMAALVVLCQGGLLYAQQQMPVGPVQTAEPPLTVGRTIRSEVMRFVPSTRLIELCSYIADYHASWAADRACLFTDRPIWDEYVKHTRWRSQAWKYLLLADRPPYMNELEFLRSSLPPGWYESGRMPHPIPWFDLFDPRSYFDAP